MKIFECKDNKVIQGDSLEVLSIEVSDNPVDLIFVDTPYNIGKNLNGHKDKWATDEDYLC